MRSPRLPLLSRWTFLWHLSALLILAMALDLGAPARSGLAAELPVENASFENPPLQGFGDAVAGSIPGWTLVDPDGQAAAGHLAYGVWFPNRFLGLLGGAPDGNNVAFVFSDAPVGSGLLGIEQRLTVLIEANTSYALAVKVGDRSGGLVPEFVGFPGYRIELWAGDRLLNADDNTSPPGEGLFSTSTVRYTAGASDPSIGQPLAIRLENKLGAPGVEVEFDAVRLGANPAEVETVPFFFSDADGWASGTFSYDRSQGDDQSIPEEATLFVTDASGELASLAGFDFTGGVVNATQGRVLEVGLPDEGVFFSLVFGQVVSLSGPLPIDAFRPDASILFVDSLVAIDGSKPGSVFEVPEPDPSWVLWACVLFMLAGARLRPLFGKARADSPRSAGW